MDPRLRWRWQRPLYEGQLSIRGHASAVLGDKLLVFGGIRAGKKKQEEQRLSAIPSKESIELMNWILVDENFHFST